MKRWEYEIVEFKVARGQYGTDKAGQYFSAISNEANLKQQQFGWFILGVSEEKNNYPVGTNFNKVQQGFEQGQPKILENSRF